MVRGEGMLFHRNREVAAGLSGSGVHIKELWEMPPEEKGCVSGVLHFWQKHLDLTVNGIRTGAGWVLLPLSLTLWPPVSLSPSLGLEISICSIKR